MKRSNNLGKAQLPTPEIAAREFRGMYATYFLAPAVCAIAAIALAVGHEWMYSAAFAASSLLYLPVAWRQYRNDKTICEKAILKYHQWYQQERDEPKQ